MTRAAGRRGGLLAGLVEPIIGVAASVGFVLYFTGAAFTVIHARSYAHIPFPLLYMAPVIGLLFAA